MIIKLLLDNWVTDQLKERESQESRRWGSQERDRERKKEKRNKDSEIKKAHLGLLQKNFFFLTKELDFQLRFLCLSTKPIHSYGLKVMFLASWTLEVIYKVSLTSYWVLSAGKMNQTVQVSGRNYDKSKDQINWFAASSINVLFKMMIMHQ